MSSIASNYAHLYTSIVIRSAVTLAERATIPGRRAVKTSAGPKSSSVVANAAPAAAAGGPPPAGTPQASRARA